MFNAQGSCNVDETTFSTALVLQASSTHRNKGVETQILRIEDVAHVGRTSWHTAWVAIHDLNDAKVGVIQIHRQGDCLARSVLVDVVGNTSRSRGCTGEVADKLAKCHVSNKGQAVHLTVLGKDRADHCVERTLTNG